MDRPNPADRMPENEAGGPVRPSGPENMANPPKEWKKVDEESDQSFPASDPPGNY